MPRTNRTTLALVCLLGAGVPVAAGANPPGSPGLKHRVVHLEQENARLGQRVAALEEALEQVEALLSFVRLEPGAMNGLSGPHWIIEGANLHVRSGSGETSDGCSLASPSCESLTGLGNLVVGYNDVRSPRPGQPPDFSRRTGSHNLIVGSEHRYPSFAGLVAGNANVVSGAFASATGGSRNEASGGFSSVSGGFFNEARGSDASVSGGSNNLASGLGSSVSGGSRNEAGGLSASVSGGSLNVASGSEASVGGGTGNQASGVQSSVSAGIANVAAGTRASVGGGSNNLASGFTAAISGGFTGEASGSNATVTGGFGNHAAGAFSSVGGGRERSAPDAMNWAAGSLLEAN